jgi:hypothetical protein
MPIVQSEWGRQVDCSDEYGQPCEERPHNIDKNLRLLEDTIDTLGQAVESLFADINPVLRPDMRASKEAPDKIGQISTTVSSSLASRLGSIADKVLTLTLDINSARQRIDL